ncbi:NHLP leader peptide family RiPP precursor [Rhabdochromatium marinum]|uniref:NHLP leader peptide family RiPP precursor n=1 Tax=Rhabdochromatium marinum TaxID=48729 RepID=UPI001904B0DF|nr:NHLP leader peptide family RiPP precursor [Rhabdochromatium marinum]MBK1649843.1 hypothetical protein [Rhabdochromatium marinum]
MAASIKAKTVYGAAIAKSWKDPAYKQRLLNDPNAVLKEEGLDIPAGVKVEVLEDTDQIKYVALPPDMHSDHPDKDKLYGFLGKNFPLESGQEIRLVQNSDTMRYLTIPVAATILGAAAVSDADLDRVAGGDTEATTTNTTEAVEAETTEVTVTETTELQDTETTTTAVAEVEVAVVPGFIT